MRAPARGSSPTQSRGATSAATALVRVRQRSCGACGCEALSPCRRSAGPWPHRSILGDQRPPRGLGTYGRLGLVDMIEVPAGHMPPLHVHHGEDEGFYLMEGEVTLYLPSEETACRPGDFFLAPVGCRTPTESGIAPRAGSSRARRPGSSASWRRSLPSRVEPGEPRCRSGRARHRNPRAPGALP